MTRPSAGLRQLVHERAGGRCEYCGLPEAHGLFSHQVDHVIPEKHRGPTTADNLALSCVLCNRRKGSDLSSIDPHTGRVAILFNPRTQWWSDHFRLENGRVVPLTPEGRATAALLDLNHPARVEERMALIRAAAYTPPGKPDAL